MRILNVNPIRKNTIIILSSLWLSSCALPETVQLGEPNSEWDFDHQLQFNKTQFDDTHYQLEVISHNVNFYQMSAFLLRRSYLICGEYGYQLTIIKGVESFDQKRMMPNLITSNLVAKLECPSNSNQVD